MLQEDWGWGMCACAQRQQVQMQIAREQLQSHPASMLGQVDVNQDAAGREEQRPGRSLLLTPQSGTLGTRRTTSRLGQVLGALSCLHSLRLQTEVTTWAK